MSATKTSQVERAYERLKEEILQNRLPPGFQGPEPEVAERLGMSRTPVREALIRLQSEGLVELIPRRGIRVMPISPADMRDIYQILTALEPEAAAQVARDGLPSDAMDELEAATTDMENALKTEDLDTWAASDDHFHRVLLTLNENRRLSAFVNNLFDQAHRARMVTLHLRDLPLKSTREHRMILDAIKKGDANETYKVFRAHRERAATELVSVLEKTRLTHV